MWFFVWNIKKEKSPPDNFSLSKHKLDVINIITVNIEKFKSFIKNSSSIKEIINAYDDYINANQFSDLKCPCCKCKKCLAFHKYYERNLVFEENGIICNETLKVGVVECENCKKKGICQKYHALLPEFILPYHIYESSLIIKAIYDYITKEKKLTEILERVNITHKLFYDWMILINKYSLSSSIVLKINNHLIEIVKEIYKLNHKFLISFYQDYNHPFFLNKITCVKLVISA